MQPIYMHGSAIGLTVYKSNEWHPIIAVSPTTSSTSTIITTTTIATTTTTNTTTQQ